MDELISRQAVDVLVDELARAISDERCCISRGRSTATIMQDILDLPPVKPQEPSGDEWEDGYKRAWAEAEVFFEQEPKTGHWIIIDDCEKFIAKCSECGRIEDSRMISKYPYCHCGAKMIEPQESEDKCKNCEYYRNPDYTRCHECEAESEDKE